MELSRSFRLSVYLLVLTGIVSLALAEGVVAYLLVSVAAASFGWWFGERAGRVILSRRALNVLVLASAALAAFDGLLVSQDLVLALAHFLLAVQVLKLLGPKADRDYIQLFAVSLLHLCVAAVLTIDLAFAVPFVIYMVLGTWTLILFHLKREAEASGAAPGAVAIGRELFAATAGVTLAGLALTGFFFVISPRLGAGFLSHGKFRAQRLSGFSEEVGIDDIGSIKENPEVVMRVQVPHRGRGFPAEPLWRGVAYDRYAGGRWTRSWRERGAPAGPERRERPVAYDSPFSRTFEVSPLPPGSGEDQATLQVFFLAPLDSEVLFALAPVSRIRFEGRSPTFLRVDPCGSVATVGERGGDAKYVVTSVLVDPLAARGATVRADGRIDGLDYLALPDDLGGRGEVSKLARRVALEARAERPYDRAVAIERHLQTAYGYSLETNEEAEGDPIEAFLFQRRTGHCEYFASAMVAMLRTQGIPARLVNGFRAGEWNSFGSYWLVRQMDAHAWAEAHFEGVGWVAFDPTPGGPGRGEPGALGAALSFVDYLRLRWMNYVISYSFGDQVSLARAARQWMDAARERMRAAVALLRERFPRLDAPGGSAVAIGGALLIAGLLAGAASGRLPIFEWWTTGAGPRGARTLAPEVRFYRDLLRILERRGFQRRQSETPLEFAVRVAREGGAAYASVPEAAAAFCRVRFGERPLESSERRHVEALVAAIASGRSTGTLERRS